MTYNLINESITQYFGDAAYHCIPPTIRKYKLFIISGFNMKEKKSKYTVFHLFLMKKLKHIINYFLY